MASIFARALWSAVNNPLFTFTGLCDLYYFMPIPSPCIFMDLMCVSLSVTWPDISRPQILYEQTNNCAGGVL